MQATQIAQRIKGICETHGVAISTVLKACNLTKGLIYDLEKRNSFPSCDKISRIADYLNCSVDYLIGRTDNPDINR